MLGGNVCNSFLESLPLRKHEIRRTKFNQSLKVLSEENCSILDTWLDPVEKRESATDSGGGGFYAPARSLRCGPFKAPFGGARGKQGKRALSSGYSHDRGVEFPDRCDLRGTAAVVEILEGHPQDLDWQGYWQFAAVLGIELKAMFRQLGLGILAGTAEFTIHRRFHDDPGSVLV